jgi:hypothetical protein
MTISSLDETILRILPADKDSDAWMPTSLVIRLLKDRGLHVHYARQVCRRLARLEQEKLVLSSIARQQLLWQRNSWLHGANQMACLMASLARRCRGNTGARRASGRICLRCGALAMRYGTAA